MAAPAPAPDATKLFRVDGLVALVTGGGSGIGRMLARALAANGARAVYILGRRLPALEETASLAPPGVIIPLQGDVTSKESLAGAAERVRTEVGYLNVLVANSGVNGPSYLELLPPATGAADGNAGGPSLEAFADAMWAPSMEEFTQTVHVNATGAVFYSALAFLRLLDAGNKQGNVRQKSQVLVVSSGAAFNRRVAAGFAYSASKAAAQQLALMLATSFLPYLVRVNCVQPGLYPTDITAHRLPRVEEGRPLPWEEGGLSAASVPLMRCGSEEDMAGVGLFMMSAAGAYLNGASILADGGRISM